MTVLDSATLNWEALVQEAKRHLQALLRCDTTNPPGNEALAAAYLRAQLVAEGIEPRLIEPAPGRVSVWARLPGSGISRSLLLASHTDVVPVERDQWHVDPFGGEERDGFIYGRGAVDMKDMLAMELTLFLHFARQAQISDQRLDRDLFLLSVADEEVGAKYGMSWIVENAPELVDAEYALNEGGGMGVDFGRQRVYLCEMAQKGSIHITLRANGAPGHASIPHGDSAIARLARALTRITSAPLPMRIIPTSRRLIELLAVTQTRPRRSLLLQVMNPLLSERVLGLLPDRDTANALRAMLHSTASPTLLQAGTALNVIPGEATAQLDCRIVPGETVETLTTALRKRIRDPKVVVEADSFSPGYEMQITPLFTTIQHAIAAQEPGAVVAPYLFPAVSDSRFLAPRGVTAYGFVPHRPEPGVPPVQSLAHGHDERVSIANLEFGLKVLHSVINEMSTTRSMEV
jgi:acetylornithine deacetylase/succinyl-diaminopimelate desuccinylase-like protein